MGEETEAERNRRVQRRALFDAVADLYDETRVGYPEEVIDDLFRIAGLGVGSPVLEVGCGTGQLTVDLARRGVALTAIDIGPAMVAATVRKVSPFSVTVQHCAFEDFDAGHLDFEAVVSATAFHWIDPRIAWKKTASLLRPGGWVAILATSEQYDDPLGSAFRQQWIRYSADGVAWAAPQPTLAETIASSGLFCEPITSTHSARRAMAPNAMIRLEHTRATTLSYDPDTRDRFFADLAQLLGGLDEVALTQNTTLTMAQVK